MARVTKKRVKAGTSKVEAAKRRALFVEAYITNGGNATQAAIKAGFAPGSADVTGARLLVDPRISGIIASRRSEIIEKAKLSTDDVLISLARAVRFDPRRLYHPDGRLRAIHELDDDTALAIQGIDVDEIMDGGKIIGTTKKFKAADRNVAREQALKVHGLFEKDNRQRPTAVGPVIVSVDPVEAAKAYQRLIGAK